MDIKQLQQSLAHLEMTEQDEKYSCTHIHLDFIIRNTGHTWSISEVSSLQILPHQTLHLTTAETQYYIAIEDVLALKVGSKSKAQKTGFGR